MLSNVFIAPETIQMTLDQGVNVNARDKDGQTPLHALATTRTYSFLPSFLPAATGQFMTKYGETLSYILRMLMEVEINLDAQDRKRNTALHLLHFNKTAEAIMEQGANVLIRNNKNRTPFEHLRSISKSGNYVEPKLLALMEKWHNSAAVKNELEKKTGLYSKVQKKPSRM